MKTFAFIFARGGSKGIPNKNIKKILGKPLIYYTIQIVKKIKQIDKLFVSTDSNKIAEISQKLGAAVIKRPKKLAKDDSPEWEAWQHAIRTTYKRIGNFDRFISLPPTCPLRGTQDIKNCLLALDDKTDFVVTMSTAKRDPSFNMVKLKKKKYIELLKKNTHFKITRRQDSNQIFDLTTGCYVSRPKFILKKTHFWDGRVSGVLMPEDRAIDIDTKLDFEIAKYLIKNKRKII
jgi:N-acylneuraminate cytidylyltransferase